MNRVRYYIGLNAPWMRSRATLTAITKAASELFGGCNLTRTTGWYAGVQEQSATLEVLTALAGDGPTVTLLAEQLRLALDQDEVWYIVEPITVHKAIKPARHVVKTRRRI